MCYVCCAVCILFLVKLKWPKNKSVYDAIAGFQCHAIQIDQNKNQNRSIDKVQNLGNERRQICKDSSQNSGHSNFSYARCAEKCFTQIYRDLYGDAMLVPIRMGTNMAAGN